MLSKHALELLYQARVVVLGRAGPLGEGSTETIQHAGCATGKDLATMIHVKLDAFSRRDTGGNTTSKDAAGGGAGHQVEIAMQRLGQLFLEPIQPDRGDQAADPTTIETHNAVLGQKLLLINRVPAISS